LLEQKRQAYGQPRLVTICAFVQSPPSTVRSGSGTLDRSAIGARGAVKRTVSPSRTARPAIASSSSFISRPCSRTWVINSTKVCSPSPSTPTSKGAARVCGKALTCTPPSTSGARTARRMARASR